MTSWTACTWVIIIDKYGEQNAIGEESVFALTNEDQALWTGRSAEMDSRPETFDRTRYRRFERSIYFHAVAYVDLKMTRWSIMSRIAMNIDVIVVGLDDKIMNTFKLKHHLTERA